MKKLFLLLVLLAGTLLISSCNTMRGAGEDIEEVGEGVKDATR